jgi:hypothetical protein
LTASLVLAIEPDTRQAAVLKRVVHDRVHAEIIVVDSKDAAIASIAARVPDLILVTALLSPRDEEELVAHLRTLAEAAHLQTITIPQLATAGAGGSEREGGFFSKTFRRKKQQSSGVGCDPWGFADQVAGYLRAAAEARAARLAALAYEQSPHPFAPLTDAAAQMSREGTEAAEQRAEAHGGGGEARDHRRRSNPGADIVEVREATAHADAVNENPPEQVFTDPDYAFSWRSSTSEVRGQRSEVRAEARGQGPEARGEAARARARGQAEPPPPPPVILPPSIPAVPELEALLEASEPSVPAPEPITAEPEPVVAPVEPEPLVLAPQPEPVYVAAEPEPVLVAPEPVFVAPEPVLVAPEPVLVAPEPVFVAPEPVIITPEPVIASEPVTVPLPAKAAKAHKGARASRAAKAHPVVLRPLKRLPPLAMWARVDEPPAAEAPARAPHARNEDDDLAALIGSLRVPAQVLAVSYPRRPFIHRVRSV